MREKLMSVIKVEAVVLTVLLIGIWQSVFRPRIT